MKQQPLPIDPATRGYPRSTKGEYGSWQNGSCFTPWQAEWHKLEGRYASIHAQFGIVELEDGTWLSDLHVWDERHPTRADALWAAGERVIHRAIQGAKPYTNGSFTFSPRMTLGEANAIIAWASGEIGEEPKLLTPDDLPRKSPNWADLPLFSKGLTL
jgi:hypothetical protein